jgi:hypothetical protein
VGRVWDCMMCTCVSEDGGDGEGADSEAPSLLSYTLRYVSLAELGHVCQFGLREPMHLCASQVYRDQPVSAQRDLYICFYFSTIFSKLKRGSTKPSARGRQQDEKFLVITWRMISSPRAS